MVVGLIALGGLIFLGVVLAVLNSRGVLLCPLLLFLGLEVVVTWPSLLEYAGAPGVTRLSPFLFAMAGAGMLVLGFVVAGGFTVAGDHWRRDRTLWPAADELRNLTLGIALLAGVLVVLSIWRYGGLPPMLTGGFRGLIDPLANSQDVALVREGRRVMTKGYLVGEAYAGQGLLNNLTEVGWQMLVIAATYRQMIMRSSRSLTFLAFFLILAFVFLGSTGQRAPLLFALGGIVATVIAFKRVPLRRLAVWGLAMLAFLVFIAPLSKGASVGSSVTERLGAAVSRVTEGNGQNNVALIELVEAGVLEPAYGDVFVERVLVMIPGAPSDRPFALRLTELAYGAGENVTGFATPTGYGLFYADGRGIGVVIGYFVTGLLLAWGWRALCRLRGIVAPVVFVQGALILGYASITGVQGVVSSVALMGVCAGILGLPSWLSKHQMPGGAPSRIAHESAHG